MRKDRLLVQDAWYEVRTAINNREPPFRRRQAVAIFCRVFGEAHGRFAFELRGFRLEEEWLSFYIRPPIATSGDHAVGEADVYRALQPVYVEDRACLGRPVLVAGGGRGAAGRGRGGGLGGSGCGG